MITIEEKQTKKLPGFTSLFLSSKYNPYIIDVIRDISPKNFDKKSNVWELPITSLHVLLNELAKIDEIELSFLQEEKTDEDKKITISKNGLFPHQKEAVIYGLNHNKWLLLDSPGLGKTLSMITLAEELKKRDNIKHCLIICGVNTLKSNWCSEIKKFSKLSCRILGQRINKKGKIIIGSMKDRIEELKHPIKEFFIVTNVETIRSNDVVKALKTNKCNIDMIVVDEIHQAKNPQSQQGKNLLQITAKYQIGLTGTVITNNPLDAYLPLKWIGVDRSTYSNFKYFYCEYGGLFHNDIIGYKHIDMLKEQLKSISLRRTKDLLNLPEKNIIYEECDMNNDQHTFYSNLVNGIIDQVDKTTIDTTSTLAMITRLRQATSCPSMLTTENISSAKQDRCCDLVDQIIANNEKVVIFSGFKNTIYELEKKLSKYNPLIGTGDISDTTIRNNIEDFQTNDNKKLFLCTYQKMGTGITLNKASYAIFIDTPWTAALQQQCEDRIHRIGSKKPVFIYILKTKDTIDEQVIEIVNDKSMISDYVVDDKISTQLYDKLKNILIELKDK